MIEAQQLSHAFVDNEKATLLGNGVVYKNNSFIIQHKGSYRFQIVNLNSLKVYFNGKPVVHDQSNREEEVMMHSEWCLTDDKGDMMPIEVGGTISWDEHYTATIRQVPTRFRVYRDDETKYLPGYTYKRMSGHKNETWELVEWVCVYDPRFDKNGFGDRDKKYRWRAKCDGVLCWTDDYLVDQGTPINTEQ